MMMQQSIFHTYEGHNWQLVFAAWNARSTSGRRRDSHVPNWGSLSK